MQCHEKTEKRRRLALLALLALLLLFIFGNSLLPPSLSWQLTDAVQSAAEDLLPLEQADAALARRSGYSLRKLTHFSEYALLALVLGTLLAADRHKQHLPTALLLGILTALLDETVQRFTGRTSSVLDVWLDTAGFAAGLALLCLLYRLRKRRQQTNDQS
ncbi:MAG: VanZ family protein [Clostridia bacterium]|nr:VanZ family protein [Clostridia bacterium]